jgi:hypothetical protein
LDELVAAADEYGAKTTGIAASRMAMRDTSELSWPAVAAGKV